ncbi:MAG: hypothetical protein ACOC33_02085 [bacterium]
MTFIFPLYIIVYQTVYGGIIEKIRTANIYLLCSDGSFISDTYDEHGDNHVLYKCKKCGTESDFNFDIAPIPINWNDLR